MGMIEDLYEGEVSFAEDFGYSRDGEWDRLREESEVIRQHILKALDDKQKEELSELMELRSQMAVLEIDRMFAYGFRAGAKLVIDIYKEE